MQFAIDGEKINTEEVNFINIIYIDEETLNVKVHMGNGEIKEYFTKDEAIFEGLDKYCDICSEK